MVFISKDVLFKMCFNIHPCTNPKNDDLYNNKNVREIKITIFINKEMNLQ